MYIIYIQIIIYIYIYLLSILNFNSINYPNVTKTKSGERL